MNLEWFKKHPYAAAGGILAALVIFIVIFRSRSGGGGGGLESAIAQQNAGQLQMAQLNAQLSSASEQTQAQLAAHQLDVNAATQEQQTALAGQIASSILPIQFESEIYKQELAAQAAHEATFQPLLQEALQISRQGNRAQTGENELAILLGAENPNITSAAGGLPVVQGQSKGFGFGFGLGPLSVGLFG